MTTRPREARLLTLERIGWWGMLLVGIAMVVWTGPKFWQLQHRRQQANSLRTVDAEETAQIGQLDAWQTAADEALAQAKADREALLSMYRSCRNLDDFFVVHPDRIAVVYGESNDRFHLTMYVPQGAFQVVADVTPETDGQGDGAASLPESLEPQQHVFSLDGGRAYRMDVELDDDNESQARLQITFTDHEPFVFPLGAFQNVGSRRTGPPDRLVTPYRWARSGTVSEQALIDHQFHLMHREDQLGARIRLRVSLKATGPVRFSASDRILLMEKLNTLTYGRGGSSPANLEYRDGWYYETSSPKLAE